MTNRIKRIVVHWSASAKETTINDIRRWHVVNNGWRDIGYHRIILHPDSHQIQPKKDLFWSDLVKQGRTLDNNKWLESKEVGAHAYGFNSDSVGVCVVGHPSYKIDPLQAEALKQTLIIFLDRFELTRAAVVCHRDLMATECPGAEIYSLIQEFKNV